MAGTYDHLSVFFMQPPESRCKTFFIIHAKYIIQDHRERFLFAEKLSCCHTKGKINLLQCPAAQSLNGYDTLPCVHRHMQCLIHQNLLVSATGDLT